MDAVPFLDLGPTTAEVRGDIRDAWRRLLDESEFIGGSAVAQFERSWAAYCGTRHAVGVANGTDALALALRATGIGPGHDVVIPTNTFVATAEAVVAVGATPRFADVDPETLLLTADTLTAALTPRTHAVIAVHLYGQPVDMDVVGAAARRHGLVVIEDAAQAHGATWRGRPVGSFGDAGCFSFYPSKNLGAFGDAGAIVTSDPDVDACIRELRDHGRVVGTHHTHARVGTNSRLDTLQAAVLCAKLPRLDAWNRRRREIVDSYRAAVDGDALRPVRSSPDARCAPHLAVIRCRRRDEVQQRLGDAGIGTGIHYPVPCHRQPAFLRDTRGETLPVAEAAADEILSLPLFPQMTSAQVGHVCEILGSAARPVALAGAR